MRILSIEGSNLASLKGDFGLDLRGEILGQAGLFAITGATGSGKTTLLDALCLALFDNTPRLAAGGSARIGYRGQEEKDRISASDVRNLLRRGTASGRAEVHFQGVDDREYCARWEVRRARNRPSGRLQVQTQTLVDVESGLSLGGTRTETLKVIEERLGLNFEQFCRSALLAQGEFAAFLRAKESKRAQLLERITGTSIYGRISREVYFRSKRESDGLARLQERLELLELLTPERRAELEEELKQKAAGLKAGVAVQDELAAEVAWFSRLAALEAAERGAAERAKEAQDGWSGAEADRERLAGANRAEPLRSWLSARDRARAEAKRAEEAQVAATAAEIAAGGAAGVAVEAAKQAIRARDEARTARESAGPALEQAAKLDHEVEGQRQRVLEQRTEAGSTSKQASAARKEADELEAGLQRSGAALEETARWLEERDSLRPLAGEWARAELDLEAVVEASETSAGLELERLRLVEGEETCQAAVGRAREAVSASDEETVAAEAEVRELRSKAPGAAREQIAATRKSLEREAGAAREARELTGRAEEQAGRLAQEQAKLSVAQAQAEEAGARAAELQARVGQEKARAKGIEDSLEVVRLELDLAAHRHRLREGEPCPLCGGLEHPAAGDTPAPEVVTRLDGELAGTRSEIDELVRAQADEAARARAAESSATEAGVVIEATQRELQRCRKAWAALLDSSDGSLTAEGPELEEGREQAAAWIARTGDARLELDSLDEQLSAHEASLRAAEAAVSRVRKARDDCRATLQTRERELLDAHKRLDDLATRQRVQADRRERALAALAPLLERDEGWQEALQADPRGASSRLSDEVGQWLDRERSRVALQEQVRQERGRLEVATERARSREEAAQEREAALAAQVGALEALEAQRAALLGGRPTPEVRAELDGAVTAAEHAFEVSRTAREEQERLAAEARALAAEAGARLDQERTELAAAEVSLTEQLVERGLREQEVRAQLLPIDELEALRTQIQALKEASTAAEAVLKERRQQTRDHSDGRSPERSSEEAATALEAAREVVAAARKAVSGAEFPLKSDDANQHKATELAPKLEEQRSTAEVWSELNGLVGQADGSKFRKYAQGLTLERLLLQANEHLDDLVPRYRLERIPGGSSDMELQVVDRDMGDEVRPVTSLSGGESFLVSLALALGLSSLSARDTSVDSLFIDEGFGTLDSDTLAVAIGVLEALQSQGRQVGVISHVEGLASDIGVRVEVVRVAPGWSKVSQPQGPGG